MTKKGDLTRHQRCQRQDLDIQPPAGKSAFLLKSTDCPVRPAGPRELKGRGHGLPAPCRCRQVTEAGLEPGGEGTKYSAAFKLSVSENGFVFRSACLIGI